MELTNLDSPSMHFAVGMLLTGILCVPIVLLRPNFWPLVPIAQSIGGVFALVPDFWLIPSYYPSVLDGVDAREIKRIFDGPIGNLFFFHAAMDKSGEGSFLRGFIWVAVQYNIWVIAFAFYYYNIRSPVRPNTKQSNAYIKRSSRKNNLPLSMPLKNYESQFLTIDEARQVITLPRNEERARKLEIALDTISTYEVLFNREPILRIGPKEEGDDFDEKTEEALVNKLNSIEGMPMDSESKRAIDLRLGVNDGTSHSINFYYRKGNYRYSHCSFAQSSEKIVKICAILSSIIFQRSTIESDASDLSFG